MKCPMTWGSDMPYSASRGSFLRAGDHLISAAILSSAGSFVLERGMGSGEQGTWLAQSPAASLNRHAQEAISDDIDRRGNRV